MEWKVAVLLLIIGKNDAHISEMFNPTTNRDLVEAVVYIAENNFEGDCLSVLFPSPLPDLAFGDMIQYLHSRWAVYLPSYAPRWYINVTPFDENESGVLVRTHCSYIITIHNSNYSQQVSQLMYSTWRTYYVDSDNSNINQFILVVDGEIEKEEAYNVLKMMTNYGDINAVIVGFDTGKISVFTIFPFGKDGLSCPENNSDIVLLEQWHGYPVYKSKIFPSKVPMVFQGCQLPITAVELPPSIFKLHDVFEGIDYKMIKDVAKYFNMTLNVSSYYTQNDGWLYIGKDNCTKGSINDLRKGKVWIHISGLSNDLFHYASLVIGTGYLQGKYSWYCPNPLPLESWKLVYLAFSQILWIWTVGTTVLFPMVFFIFVRQRENEKKFHDIWACFFALLSVALGNSMGVFPKHKTLRILLTSWLFFTHHIDNAYTASLTGLMSGGLMDSKVTTPQDMIRKNFSTGLQHYLFRSSSSINDTEIKPLLDDAVPVVDYILAIKNMITYRNSCYVDNEYFLDYLITKEKMPLYRTPMRLYSARPMGIMMRRNHFLLQRVDTITRQLFAAGINTKYVREYTVALWLMDKKATINAMKLKNIAGPFLLYASGNFVALCSLLLEWVHHSFKNKHLKNVIQNLLKIR